MKALVLGDTHLTGSTLDRMPSEVWAEAEEADVILHAGDVLDPAVLSALGERAPVHAVLGNNDRLLRGRLPEVLQVELDGVVVGMIHDSGSRAGRGRRMGRRFPDAGVVVYGHSHEPCIEQVPDGPLLVNPGSPTQRRRQPVHTIGRLQLAKGAVVVAEIVQVGPLAAR